MHLSTLSSKSVASPTYTNKYLANTFKTFSQVRTITLKAILIDYSKEDNLP